jgi:hypothetical protein
MRSKPPPATLEGEPEPVIVVLVISDTHAFAADIAFASGIIPVPPYFHYPVTFNFNLEASVLRAENTACFFPSTHDILLWRNL